MSDFQMRCACTDGLGPLGEALAEQTFMVAVCRYTHAGTATFGYSLLYSALNAGGAIAGFIIDLVKNHAGTRYHIFLHFL